MQEILTESFIPNYVPKGAKSVRLHFEFEDEKQKMTPDEFWEFCQKNPNLPKKEMLSLCRRQVLKRAIEMRN
jgi:hypothetical protein